MRGPERVIPALASRGFHSHLGPRPSEGGAGKGDDSPAAPGYPTKLKTAQRPSSQTRRGSQKTPRRLKIPGCARPTGGRRGDKRQKKKKKPPRGGRPRTACSGQCDDLVGLRQIFSQFCWTLERDILSGKGLWGCSQNRSDFIQHLTARLGGPLGGGTFHPLLFPNRGPSRCGALVTLGRPRQRPSEKVDLFLGKEKPGLPGVLLAGFCRIGARKAGGNNIGTTERNPKEAWCGRNSGFYGHWTCRAELDVASKRGSRRGGTLPSQVCGVFFTVGRR